MMKRKVAFTIAFVWLFPAMVLAYEWREGERLPAEGLRNPYGWSESELTQKQIQGLGHALIWPVEVTGVLLPERPLAEPLWAAGPWLGLIAYPQREGDGAYFVPFPRGLRPSFRMGYSQVERDGVTGVTFSCAACHSAKVFGRRVLGLTNRFARANEVFIKGVEFTRRVKPEVFKHMFFATDEETALYRQARERLKFVEAKLPLRLGLDTSLAHVALSLSRRAPDAWASMEPYWSDHPREEPLRHIPADSKPAVWWNVKYKNKWLSDGSVVSGNPILTNLLWNEIGRGTDLHILNQWLKENPDVIEELTTAVYASEPPSLTDFIDVRKFDLGAAMRGEGLFLSRCSQCHGVYEKGWNEPGAADKSIAEQMRTVRFIYHEDTPVRDVGTDPLRRLGMNSLLQLNDLQISKVNGILIRLQSGYVPPPLLGIWIRYPYLHNNSVPNLCELLKPAGERVKEYWAGPADNINRDYDLECGGYPIRDKTPPDWRLWPERKFDTRVDGMSNMGHDRGMGELTERDRRDLIKFLQTL